MTTDSQDTEHHLTILKNDVRFRVLSKLIEHPSQPNRFFCHVLDLSNNEVRLLAMPRGLSDDINDILLSFSVRKKSTWWRRALEIIGLLKPRYYTDYLGQMGPIISLSCERKPGQPIKYNVYQSGLHFMTDGYDLPKIPGMK